MYFGGKATTTNIFYEPLMMNRVNYMKALQKMPALYNVIELKLGDYITNTITDEFIRFLVYMFKEALINPTAIK